MNYPIIEFFDEPAIIGEQKYKFVNEKELLKKYNIDTVLFVFRKEVKELIQNPDLLEDFFDFSNSSATYKCYIYNKKFLVAVSPVGAPSATLMMEAFFFMGIKNFYACGSCGRISEEIESDKFLLVEKAIRSEGVSYHYLKPSIYAETDKELSDNLAKYLDNSNLPYKRSIVWTTDGFFRETNSEILVRKQQGAIGVEMECASWCAVAKYRKIKFAQLLYFSDTVKKKEWKLHDSIQESRKAIIYVMLDYLNNL